MADIAALLRHVPDAIKVIDQVFETSETAHSWQSWRQDNNILRLVQHFECHISDVVEVSDKEDHLANLACRALILLQLREEVKTKPKEKDGDS